MFAKLALSQYSYLRHPIQLVERMLKVQVVQRLFRVAGAHQAWNTCGWKISGKMHKYGGKRTSKKLVVSTIKTDKDVWKGAEKKALKWNQSQKEKQE